MLHKVKASTGRCLARLRLFANCARDGLSSIYLLLFLLSSFFLFFVRDGLLVFAADELDQSHFGAVAFAGAEFEDSRVSTRTVGEAIGQLSGQFLQGADAWRVACTAASFWPASRAARARRPRVTAFSAKGRNSFAFGSVVMIRS